MVEDSEHPRIVDSEPPKPAINAPTNRDDGDVDHLARAEQLARAYKDGDTSVQDAISKRVQAGAGMPPELADKFASLVTAQRFQKEFLEGIRNAPPTPPTRWERITLGLKNAVNKIFGRDNRVNSPSAPVAKTLPSAQPSTPQGK